MGPERAIARELEHATAHGRPAWAGLLRRLRPDHRNSVDPNLRYRVLFECVSDGFALVEPIRDADGHLSDYVVLEANPALLRILRLDASPVGKRGSEVLRNAPPSWLQACEHAMGGRPLTFEYHARQSDNWYEIHLSRIT